MGPPFLVFGGIQFLSTIFLLIRWIGSRSEGREGSLSVDDAGASKTRAWRRAAILVAFTSLAASTIAAASVHMTANALEFGFGKGSDSGFGVLAAGVSIGLHWGIVGATGLFCVLLVHRLQDGEHMDEEMHVIAPSTPQNYTPANQVAY